MTEDHTIPKESSPRDCYSHFTDRKVRNLSHLPKGINCEMTMESQIQIYIPNDVISKRLALKRKLSESEPLEPSLYMAANKPAQICAVMGTRIRKHRSQCGCFSPSLSLMLFPWTITLRKLQIPNVTSKSPPWWDRCLWLPNPLLSSVDSQYSKSSHIATCLPTTSVLLCSLSPRVASTCLLKLGSTFASCLHLPPSSASLAMCALIAHFDGVFIMSNTLSLSMIVTMSHLKVLLQVKL